MAHKFAKLGTVAFVAVLNANVALAQDSYGPADLVRLGATWQFPNGTPRLTVGNYMEAFNLDAFDMLHPLHWAILGIGKASMGSGSCFGMSLAIAHVADRENEHRAFGSGAGAFYGTLRNPLWDNYPTPDDNLRDKIGTFHWKQFSVGYIRAHLSNITYLTPLEMAKIIQQDAWNNRFGTLSITKDLKGHTLLPYGAALYPDADNPRTATIYVYDPNWPHGDRSGPQIQQHPLTIDGQHWHYQLRSDWAWRGENQSISYVPYNTLRDGGLWSVSVLSVDDLLVAAFSAGVDVEQVSDRAGRKLYRSSAKDGDSLDVSKTGLGKQIYRFVPQAASNKSETAKPVPTKEIVEAKEAAALAGHKAEIAARLESTYAGSTNLYVVDKSVRGLKFALKQAKLGTAVHAIIGNRDQAIEFAFSSSSARAVAPVIEVADAGNLAASISFRDRNGGDLVADVRRSVMLGAKDGAKVESASRIVAASGAPITIRAAQARALEIAGNSAQSKLKIVEQRLEASGRLRDVGVRDVVPAK